MEEAQHPPPLFLLPEPMRSGDPARQIAAGAASCVVQALVQQTRVCEQAERAQAGVKELTLVWADWPETREPRCDTLKRSQLLAHAGRLLRGELSAVEWALTACFTLGEARQRAAAWKAAAARRGERHAAGGAAAAATAAYALPRGAAVEAEDAAAASDGGGDGENGGIGGDGGGNCAAGGDDDDALAAEEEASSWTMMTTRMTT
jgi:hypothetical protein